MYPMTDQELLQLKNDVGELKRWKEQRIRQQITFPLDIDSINVINDHFMRISKSFTYDGGVGSNSFQFYTGKQGLYVFEVSPPSLNQYTVNPSSDYCNITSGNLKFFDGQTVVLFSSDTAPDPLTAGGLTTYYVRDSDGVNFKLAATLGGTAINITDTGSGLQFIAYG